MTQEDVAEALGITPEMVRKHETGRAHPEPHSRRRYCVLYGASMVQLGLEPSAATVALDGGIDSLVASITGSATSAQAIDSLDRATSRLAELHTQVSARQVLKQVLQLRANAHALLSGPIRLSQARDVYRIESELLAHACLLLSDLKQDDAAYRHGMAALTFAEEAGSSQAIIRSALAKTLRWMDRLVESADMAHLGYSSSPMTPIRLQLASYEANAAALLGDANRARAVLRRVEEEVSSCSTDSGLSAWSFPTPRRAIFALSVATHGRDPVGALHAAEVAEASWKAGEPIVKANWAQIRVGAGIAQLDNGDLEAAVAQVRPVLELPPDLRVATVTAYTANLAARLRGTQFRKDRTARELLSDVRVFTLEALQPDTSQEAS